MMIRDGDVIVLDEGWWSAWLVGTNPTANGAFIRAFADGSEGLRDLVEIAFLWRGCGTTSRLWSWA